MQFGVALNIVADNERSDGVVFREHMALGNLAEPLGFDSLFVLEHHFTGFVMSPAPLQTLAYFAGRTNRIKLGTTVIVLPWHDPIRVAEQIAVLDIMCDGRCLFAFGRGRSELEFRGFRIPMSEARERFVEASEILVGCLEGRAFEFSGKYFEIPRLSIRPRPISRPQDRFYGSSMSSESASITARLGFGMLTSTQKPWETISADIESFREIARVAGRVPKEPILLGAVSVAKSRNEAHERAFEYMGREWAMIDGHYHFSEGRLSTVRGYESYQNTERYFQRLANESFRNQATVEYVNSQIVGTPDDCVQQIHELHHLTGAGHLILEFSFGGVPYEIAEANMKLFATEVLPALRSCAGESLR